MRSISIAIRAMNNDLVSKSLSFLNNIDGQRRILFNSNSGDYVQEILYNPISDWVINLDEDCFIYDPDKLLNLIDYMDKNNYHICGISDGGVNKCRFHNPVAFNPFFNIIDVRKTSSISNCDPGKETDDKEIGSFTDDLKKFTPFHLLKYDYKYDNFQWQYYPLFFHMLRNNVNFLYLDCEEFGDGFSTIVKDHNGDPFLIHSWYARMYNDQSDIDNHTRRINNVYDFAVKQKKTNVGIVVPSFNLDYKILNQFINGVRNSKPTCTYKIYFSSNKELYKDNIFNCSKSLNKGILTLSNNCEVIICVDVDIVPAFEMIDVTYKKSIQTNSNVFMMVRDLKTPDKLYNPNNINLPLRYTGRGAWNGMTVENWFKSGGWNEDFYDWGYEDVEFHLRLLKKNIDIYTIFNSKIYHIDHPQRSKLNHSISQMNNLRISTLKDYTYYNWLDHKEN